MPLGGCANACVIFSGLAVLGTVASCWKLSSREFTFARCASGGCASACVIFFWARCARSGYKLLETKLARIYVRSLHRWAVGPTLLRDFFWARCAIGAAASCWKLSSRECMFARCATGWLRQRLRDFFWARCARGGGCKLWETELARIYFRLLCHWAVAPTLP